jgi:hypothetical protein
VNISTSYTVGLLFSTVGTLLSTCAMLSPSYHPRIGSCCQGQVGETKHACAVSCHLHSARTRPTCAVPIPLTFTDVDRSPISRKRSTSAVTLNTMQPKLLVNNQHTCVLPPGGASTREVGLSVRKLPTCRHTHCDAPQRHNHAAQQYLQMWHNASWNKQHIHPTITTAIRAHHRSISFHRPLILT